jgi:hypothetical protein
LPEYLFKYLAIMVRPPNKTPQTPQNNKPERRIAHLENLLGKCLSRLDESDKKIKDLQEMNSELEKSLNFACNKIEDVQKALSTNDTMMRRLNNIEDDQNVLRNRVDVLDNKSRNKNIRITNVKEIDGENIEQLRSRIDKIIHCTGTQCRSVAAFRIGNPRHVEKGSGPNSNQPRPIIATLSSEQDRNNVLRSAHKLKSLHEGIYIQDDVCQNTVLKRQEQMDEFKKLKSQYQTVYFRGHTLKFKGRKQSQQHQSNFAQQPQKRPNLQSGKDFPSLEHQKKKQQNKQHGKHIQPLQPHSKDITNKNTPINQNKNTPQQVPAHTVQMVPEQSTVDDIADNEDDNESISSISSSSSGSRSGSSSGSSSSSGNNGGCAETLSAVTQEESAGTQSSKPNEVKLPSEVRRSERIPKPRIHQYSECSA